MNKSLWLELTVFLPVSFLSERRAFFASLPTVFVPERTCRDVMLLLICLDFTIASSLANFTKGHKHHLLSLLSSFERKYLSAEIRTAEYPYAESFPLVGSCEAKYLLKRFGYIAINGRNSIRNLCRANLFEEFLD